MFGSSVFLCLGVCLVLFGIFGYLISIKLNEQNDKIKNMFDLICTITNDLQLIKLQTAISTHETTHTTNPNSQLTFGGSSDSNITPSNTTLNTVKPRLNESGISEKITKQNSLNSGNSGSGGNIKKIVVSDCEISDDNSDEDDDTDEDDDEETDDGRESTYDFEIDESGSNEDNTEQLLDACLVDESYYSKNINYEEINIKSIHLEKLDTLINEYINKPHFELEIASLPDESYIKQSSSSDALPTNLSTDIIQCVLIEEHDDEEKTSLPTENTKTIIVDLNSEPSPDYNKMSIHQLRKIAIERNLIDSSSKLKKNELLKLFTTY